MTGDQLYAEIGKRIASAREKKGWTQVRLAAESKLDRSHPGYIESGRRHPTVVTLKKIADSLDISLEDLFKDL